MSFRTYDPNPTLQRLRTMNAKGVNEIFKLTPVKDYIPLSSEAMKDVYDKHTISDYGNLTAPHSFAEALHEPRRFRQRRRSSGAANSLSISPTDKQRAPRCGGSQGLKAEAQSKSPNEEPELRDAAPDDSSRAKRSTPPPSSVEETQPAAGSMVTGRPVYMADEAAQDDEHASAVILKARWESFTKATPRKVRLPSKITETGNA